MGEKIIMKNKRLIAETLLELARTSETTFLDVGKDDKELIGAAKKFNITLPSPDLMVMKTVYAEIDKVNKNGVILPKKAVDKGLKTLVGKQCNWEHDGAGFVCGYTIDAKINEGKIETINVLFKSLFPEKAEELKEKIKCGEAAVSFEIWNIDPETKKSVVKSTDNGYVEINPIIFHGTGVLLVHQPACPKAKIFKLVATKEEEKKEEFVTEVFNRDLIYASFAVDNLKEKEDTKVSEEKKEVKKIEKSSEETKTEKKVEETKVEKSDEQKAEEGKEKKTDKSETAETTSTDKKVEETSEDKPKDSKDEAKEEKTETSKTDEKSEVKKEGSDSPKEDTTADEQKENAETIVPKVVTKRTRIYSDIFVDTYKDGTLSGTSEGKSKVKKITEYSDGTQDVIEEESEYVNKYDFAQVEEKVNAAKAIKEAKRLGYSGE